MKILHQSGKCYHILNSISSACEISFPKCQPENISSKISNLDGLSQNFFYHDYLFLNFQNSNKVGTDEYHNDCLKSASLFILFQLIKIVELCRSTTSEQKNILSLCIYSYFVSAFIL